jgi:hypothetical protein
MWEVPTSHRMEKNWKIYRVKAAMQKMIAMDLNYLQTLGE